MKPHDSNNPADPRFGDGPDGWCVVRDPAAADTLVDRRKARWLDPFLRSEAPLRLTDVADALGVGASTAHYQLRRLVGLGLLVALPPEPSPEPGAPRPRGRPGPRYRARARRFFVPLAATTRATMERVLRELLLPGVEAMLARRLRDMERTPERWGVGIQLTPDGLVSTAPMADDLRIRHEPAGAPGLYPLALWLPLGDADARSVADDLAALAERVQAAGDASGRRYRLVLGMVPFEDA